MKNSTHLKRTHKRLKDRLSRLGFQRLSIPKKAQLKRRLMLCEQQLLRLAGAATLATLGTTTLQAQSYCEQTGTDNVFDGLSIGGYSSKPQMVDVDGDGDLDIISGVGPYSSYSGQVLYFRNDGSNNFTEQTGGNNPFNGIDVGDFSAPQLINFDGSSAKDLIVGTDNGSFRYFRNDGSNNFAEQTGTNNPFDGISLGYDAVPHLVNLDDDLDLVVGESNGQISYFQNDGSNNFNELTGTNNPFNGIDVGSKAVPQLIDFDNDMDLDLISGKNNGQLNYYENDGSDNFNQLTGGDNPFNGIDVGTSSHPQAIDIDEDGDLDLIIGEYSGNFNYYRNFDNMEVSATTENCLMNDGTIEITVNSTETTGIYSVTGVVSGSIGSAGVMGGSGTFNASVTNPGTYNINVTSSEGCRVSTPVEIGPACALLTSVCQKTGSENPFNNLFAAGDSHPNLVDLDEDSDLDLVIGEYYGEINYFQNDGNNNFIQQGGGNNPFSAINIGSNCSPQVINFDGSDALDLIAGENDGNINYFRNDGNDNFIQQNGTNNPFNGIDVGNRSTPQLIDIDEDGDLDLISGNQDGNILFYLNDGSNNFSEQMGTDNPFDGIAVGSFSKPQLVDIDRDEDLDLIVGQGDGQISYFENDGNDDFVEQTGDNNPYDDIDAGNRSSPQAIDWDGDEDFDIVIGRSNTQLQYYQDPDLYLKAVCGSTLGEITFTVISSDTEGPYTLSGDYDGTIGMTGVKGAMETISTGITEAGTYVINVEAASSSCPRDVIVFDIAENCDENNSLEDDIEYTGLQTNTLCGADSIRSTASVEADVNLTYTAREIVILQAGFQALNGSDFLANIGDCASMLKDEEEIEARTKPTAEITLDDLVDEQTLLSVFPIPASTHLYYKIEKMEDVQALYLFDMLGRLVQTERVLDGIIDISSLANGQYILVLDGNGRKIHRLVQKQ